MFPVTLVIMTALCARLTCAAVSGTEQGSRSDGSGIAAAPPFIPPSPQVSPVSPTGYQLPSGAELVVGDYRSTFSCEGRIYGYYADQDNKCQIFHVCVPDVLADGTQQVRTFSFFCGNQTVFDQQQLACNHPSAALPCDQAQTFYSVNENFGKTDRPLLSA